MLALVATAVAGCGGESDTSGGTTTTPDPDRDAALEALGATACDDALASLYDGADAPADWKAARRGDIVRCAYDRRVTADEMTDPHNLTIRLRLNGQVMQNSSTSQMIFRTGEILAYIAQVFTLEPGDLIFTGTPPGVGMARKPEPVWLKAGDVAEVEIEGLCVLRNPVSAES